MIVEEEHLVDEQGLREVNISICSDREHPCPELVHQTFFELDRKHPENNNFRENLQGVHDFTFFMRQAYEAGKRGEQFQVIKTINGEEQ